MDAYCEKSEPAVINETLQQLDQSGILTAKRMAHILGLAMNSIYRYFNGTQLRHDQLRLLIQHGDSQVGAALLASLTSGTPHRHIYIDDALDFDGDGDVDSHDVFGHLLEALDALSNEMRLVHEGHAPDLPKFAELTACVMRRVVTAERAIAHIAAAQSPAQPNRRKARTVGGVR